MPVLAGLLARLDRTQVLNAFRRGLESEPPWASVCAAMVGLAAACGVVVLVLRIARRRRVSCIGADFLVEAARVLGLGRQEIRDLQTAATCARLAHPASLLLSPANLARAAEAARIGEEGFRVYRRLDGLSRKLFGEGLPAGGERGRGSDNQRSAPSNLQIAQPQFRRPV